jgi:hypothetical protein
MGDSGAVFPWTTFPNMCLFFLAYQKYETPSRKLSDTPPAGKTSSLAPYFLHRFPSILAASEAAAILPPTPHATARPCLSVSVRARPCPPSPHPLLQPPLPRVPQNPKGVSQRSPGLASDARLPWVMPPHTPQPPRGCPTEVQGADVHYVGQPLWGCERGGHLTQGRRSFLAPTLGIVGQPPRGCEPT